MSVFTGVELEYLASQRLGRLATVDPEGRPQVVPVAFRINPDTDTLDIGGHDFAKRKKWRDVGANPHIAFVVDDLASVNPWHPRGVEIRGDAQRLSAGGEGVVPGFDQEMFRIRPTRIRSWGLPGQRGFDSRKV